MYNIFNNNTIKENIILRNFKLNLKMSQFDKKKKEKMKSLETCLNVPMLWSLNIYNIYIYKNYL